MACQGASGAVRRRATLDTEDAIKSRMEKRGSERTHYLSFPLDYVFANFDKICYACLVVIPNPVTERG